MGCGRSKASQAQAIVTKKSSPSLCTNQRQLSEKEIADLHQNFKVLLLSFTSSGEFIHEHDDVRANIDEEYICILDYVKHYSYYFWKLCCFFQKNPTYKFRNVVGNNTLFQLSPWSNPDNLRSYLKSFHFGTSLEVEYLWRQPCLERTSQEYANDNFHKLIARHGTFITELGDDGFAWEEMPVGVIRRDVCLGTQDPSYNSMKALSPLQQQKKRLSIVKRLKGARTPHQDKYSLEMYVEHVENWVKCMEAGWVMFTALLNSSSHSV